MKRILLIISALFASVFLQLPVAFAAEKISEAFKADIGYIDSGGIVAAKVVTIVSKDNANYINAAGADTIACRSWPVSLVSDTRAILSVAGGGRHDPPGITMRL